MYGTRHLGTPRSLPDRNHHILALVSSFRTQTTRPFTSLSNLRTNYVTWQKRPLLGTNTSHRLAPLNNLLHPTGSAHQEPSELRVSSEDHQ